MKLNTPSIFILLISTVFMSCNTLQRYSISRSEPFNQHFGCDSVVVILTDNTKQHIQTNSIEFNNGDMLWTNNINLNKIDISLISQVNTIRNQSYKGDVLGFAIGGIIGYGLRKFIPAVDSVRTFRDIYATAIWSAVGWWIAKEPRTEYQITFSNSPILVPPSSIVYTEFFGRYNSINIYYEPLLSYDSTAVWGIGLRSAVQTGVGMTVPLSFAGARFDTPLIPLIVIGKEYGFEVGVGTVFQFWATKTEQFYRSDPMLTTSFIKLAGHFGYRYCSFTTNTKIVRITITPTLELNNRIAWMAGLSLSI